MASVTQTVSSYLGGVSNQPDDRKLPGQVKEALNAYPDPTFGLTKRPGFKFISELTSSSTALSTTVLDNAKWFYYNRDDAERYIGCIAGASGSPYGQVYVWNAKTYAECAVTYGTNARNYLNAVNSTDYDFITIRDTSIITNKTKVVAERTAPAENANFNATVRIKLVEYSAPYKVVLTKGSTTYTITLDTKAGDTAANDAVTDSFLKADDILQTLQSGTVANSCGAITATAVTGGSSSSHSGGLNGISGITATVISTSIELTGDAAFTVDSISGGKGGESLTAYQDSVDLVTELASETKHNRIVKVQNTASSADTYYAKFVANNATSGPGVWEETRGPGVSEGLDFSTMPHHLYNTASNTFVFSQIDGKNQDGSAATAGTLAANKWTDRLVGDATTNAKPAFVGYTIQQAFYYNNRLGFLSEDNVEMSQAGEFFNFYMITAQTATEADPIGISCSSTRPATLHGIIPTAGGLMLFSQNQQFVLFSSEGNLTPSTALIRGISNYRMDAKIDPVDVGTHINFVSKTHETAGFTRVFGLLPQSTGVAPKVVDIGRIVAEFVPATITALTASPQNSFIAMYGTSTDKIYFYRTYSDGEKDIMQTWFHWQCPGNTHFVEVDSDTMYTVIKTGTGSDARYNLCSATMTQTPEETIITTAEGQQVNPHMDFYTAATNGLSGGSEKKVVYDSTNDFSKCYIPFEDVTSLTPVIVIAGNATSNFSGTTESGFTITPTRASDGDGTYFKVPNKDLSAQAANVYVGYKYNYDITLPKIYYKKDPEGKLADFTAALTIARMKFSVGQSSVVGFKLKRKGVQAATQSFTGDGSNKIFSPDFTVKDKADVIVKKNGAKQILTTDYTIADHATNPDQVTVTFGTAPAAASTAANVTTPADTVEIYVDQWFTLQPTQDANYYLGDDVPIEEQNIFTIPIHQRTDNYTLRIFSDSPFPVALTASSWEGVYSPRYYRRT